MDWPTASTRIWLPMDLRATFSPAPWHARTSSVPASGRTAHRELRVERADQRRLQDDAFPHAFAFFGNKPRAHQKTDGDDSYQHKNPYDRTKVLKPMTSCVMSAVNRERWQHFLELRMKKTSSTDSTTSARNSRMHG